MSLHRWIALAVAAAALLGSLGGCAVEPARPFMRATYAAPHCQSPGATDATRTTPEVLAGGQVKLHYVEFDDQGWAFPDPPAAAEGGTPSRQIDCAIDDLSHTLESDHDKRLLVFVYVHGWKHSAARDDKDLAKFKLLLTEQARLVDRQIVGIYVGWQGDTIDVHGIRNITFWGRKNAAHHVSEGRVRELFSRLRGLRAYHNGRGSATPDRDCDWQPDGTDRCRLRTIMIGHSFGGLILFNSAAPYLLETLSIDRDLPATEKRPRAARARGIADLIVLLNPAFEASRYEPIFEASRHYTAEANEPPLLLSITSTADWATRVAFPVARWINSALQYPASSDDQSGAMRRTHGHIDRYLTHRLCLADLPCEREDDDPGSAPAPERSRRFCGGLLLQAYQRTLQAPRSIIWNVRTDGSIVRDHNDITDPKLIRFVSQIYGEVTGLPTDACSDDFMERHQADATQAGAAPR